MRILHTESSNGWGGQEIRILSEASGLIRRGHTVEIACPPEARIFTEAARFGVPVQALPIGRKRLPGLFALRRFLQARPFDVINTHSSTDTWLAALACLSLPDAPPIVRTRHISAAVAANPSNRWLYGKASAHVVTTGESLRRQLMEGLDLDPARVTSIPTGVDTQRHSPVGAADKLEQRQLLGLPEAALLVGIVATLRSWKGHRFLIEAFARYAPNHAVLVIVGDGPQREALEQQVAGLQLGERVHFAGNRHDVIPWLQAFDCFVLPSTANEGVPQALMQAMSTSLPCITTPIGAILEVAEPERTALVVPAQNPDAIGIALQRLIADPALGTRLGLAARQHIVSRFGREAMLDRMEAIFDAACHGAR